MASSDSGGKKEYGMRKEHKDLLIKNHTFLLGNVELSEDFLGKLLEARILNESSMEEIEGQKVKKKGIQILLRLLPKKGPKAFESFIKALAETDQEFVAEALDEKLTEKYTRGEGGQEEARQPAQEAQARGGDSRSQQVIGGTGNPVPQQLSPKEYIGENFIAVNVKSMDTTDASAQTLAKDYQAVYRMMSKPRGRAVIVNNHTFTGEFRKLSDREGTDFDATHMDQLLEQLGYKTDIWRNLKGSELRDKILQESKNEDHTNYDSFILVILTHGAQGVVYGTDGDPVSIRTIVEEFNAIRCPQLKGKPKVFFIQACQGSTKPVGVEVADSNSPEQPSQPAGMAEENMRRLEIGDTKDTMYNIPKTHEMADIVIAYATVPGYVSWRKDDSGTWFIRVLVQVFMEKAHKEHIMDMLTEVANIISRLQTKETGFVQLTETRTTLLKKMYFFPGLEGL